MVLLSLQNTLTRTPLANWQLNKSLFSNPAKTKEIDDALKEYFRLNYLDDTSPGILWAAHKVTIRGTLIRMATHIKKERQMDILPLEKTFATLKSKHKKNPSKTLLDRVDATRLELNLTLTAKVEKHIRWSGAKFYSQKDKIGSMLATYPCGPSPQNTKT